MLLNDLHRSLWLYCFHFIFPLTSFRLLLTKREVKFWFLIVVDLLSSSASSCHNHCLQKGVLSHAMQGTQFASGHLQLYIACTQPSSHTPCSLSVPCLLAKKKKVMKKRRCVTIENSSLKSLSTWREISLFSSDKCVAVVRSLVLIQ